MVTHTFTSESPVRLDVALGAGTVDVTTATTEDITVTIDGPRADEFEVTQSGDLITVFEPKLRRLIGITRGHQVSVTVPAESALRTRTGSADVNASGTFRTAEAKSGSGEVRLEHVVEVAEVMTGSGRVRIDRVGGELTVKSGSGSIRLGDAEGAVTARTGSGDLRIASTTGDVFHKTGSGSLEICSASRGRVTSKCGSGDVSIGIPDGTPVWTDVHTGSGTIRSGVAPVGEPASGQDHVELRIVTGSGDIALTPA